MAEQKVRPKVTWNGGPLYTDLPASKEVWFIPNGEKTRIIAKPQPDEDNTSG